MSLSLSYSLLGGVKWRHVAGTAPLPFRFPILKVTKVTRNGA